MRDIQHAHIELSITSLIRITAHLKKDKEMDKPKYLTSISQISELSAAEQAALVPITEKFVFRSNDYYQKLIDWNDPNDPIRAIVIPLIEELEDWGDLDASDEKSYTVVPGLEHKYQDTALLLVNDVCAAYCRFCFRKRLFMDDNHEVVRDVSEGLQYIREHREITNVLLTGGDPLVMATEKLAHIIEQIREIDHVNIIRIGTKVPAFNPARILNDPALLKTVENYSAGHRRIYIMAHFNHPVELTNDAIEGIYLLQKAGAITVNQTPLVRGINDNPDTLLVLFNLLSFIGVPSYYVFQCRPTAGNKAYSVPVEEAFEIFQNAQSRCSGLAKRARFVMSHTTGKIEVMAKAEGHVYMRYHQAADAANFGRLLIVKSNPNAHWFDDYEEANEALQAEMIKLKCQRLKHNQRTRVAQESAS